MLMDWLIKNQLFSYDVTGEKFSLADFFIHKCPVIYPGSGIGRRK